MNDSVSDVSEASVAERISINRTLRNLIFVMIAAIWGIWSISIFMTPESIASLTYDDAYYYMEVADRIVDGQGSTFDGINPTNGYHPLWMLVLVVIRSIAQTVDKITFLRLALMAQSLLTAISLLLSWHIFSPLRPVALIAGFALLLRCYHSPINAMETPLVMFAMLLMIWVMLRRKSAVLMGIGAATLLLSRLDYGIFAVALLLAWAYEQDFRSIIPAFLIPTVAGLTYVGVNLIAFGHPLPITSAIKSFRFGLMAEIPAEYLNIVPLLPAAAIPPFFGLLPSVRQRFPAMYLRVAIALTVANALHLFYMINSGLPGTWHVIPYGVTLAFSFALIFHWLPLGKITYLLIAPFVLITIALNFAMLFDTIYPRESNWSQALYKAALEVSQMTPSDSVFAMNDAGFIGYFSGRTTINTDGLINSFDTLSAMKEGVFCDLMASWDVDYVLSIQPLQNEPYSVEITYPPFTSITDEPVRNVLTMTQEDELGSFPFPVGAIYIWQYRASQCS